MCVLVVVKYFFLERILFYYIAWTGFSLIYLCISFAFWKNKKMPSYSGNFDYSEGENEFARIAYMVSSMATFILAFLFV